MLTRMYLAGLLVLIAAFRVAGKPTGTKPRQATREEVVKRMLRPDRSWTGKRQEPSAGPCNFPSGFKIALGNGQFVYGDSFGGQTPYEEFVAADSGSATTFTLNSVGQLIDTTDGYVAARILSEEGVDASTDVLVIPSSLFADSPGSYQSLFCTIAPDGMGNCPLACSGPDAGTFQSCFASEVLEFGGVVEGGCTSLAPVAVAP